MPSGIDHLHADRLLLGGAQFEERIHHARAGARLRAGKIARGLLDEGNKDRMQRKIVGQIVEAGGEQQDAAFADFFFEQQRRLIGEPGDHASVVPATRTAK